MATSHSIAWQDAEVVSSTEIADRILRITLRPSTPKKVHPGEHLKIMVNINGTEAVRSYSIVDATENGSELSLTVFHTPYSRGGSTFMHTLTAGTPVRIASPMQDFPLRVGAPDYVLVAGGIGITAIRGMASLLRKLGANYVIHYAARSPESMAYREELEAEHGDRLFTYFDSLGSHLDVPTLIDKLSPATELYMCGPIRLMDAIRRTWRERELDPTNLRFETFGNSGWFKPEKFTVAIPRLGVSTEIGENESILEALEKLGVEMMSNCRRGECGLCVVKVLEISGQIDHRDVFLSDRQKTASEKFCACVSRAASTNSDAARLEPHLTIDLP